MEGVDASVQAMGVRREGERGQGGDPQVDRPTGPQGDRASQRQGEGGAENLICLGARFSLLGALVVRPLQAEDDTSLVGLLRQLNETAAVGSTRHTGGTPNSSISGVIMKQL